MSRIAYVNGRYVPQRRSQRKHGGSRLPVRRRRLRGRAALRRAFHRRDASSRPARPVVARNPDAAADEPGGAAACAARSGAPEPGPRRAALHAGDARRRAAGARVSGATGPALPRRDDPARRRPSRPMPTLWAGGRDHPSRPALGAVRHQEHRAAAERARQAGRAGGGGLRGDPDRCGRHGDGRRRRPTSGSWTRRACCAPVSSAMPSCPAAPARR